jgi:hypothetical protein
MPDDLTDLEIAVLCDLLQGPEYQLTHKAHHILAERGVGIGEG